MSTDRLKSRLQRMEGNQRHTEPIAEVHYHVINPDRTPAMKPDGTPWVIVRKVG